MDDLEILKMLKQNDEDALNMLISKYSKYISAVIINVSKNNIPYEDVEEICSDVFVKLWQSRNKIKLKNKDIKYYLASMARNQTINFFRAKKPLQSQLNETSAITPSAEYYYILNEDSEFLNNSIDNLKSDDKELFIRRCVNLEKVNDIAKDKNMNIKTVSSKIIKAKKKLQKIIMERNGIK